MKYRYTLESSRFAQQQGRHQKYPCPQCGRRTLVRYIDTWTAHYIADDVGRCDREVNCGYHLRPSEYFDAHPSEERETFSLPPLKTLPKVGYIPGQFVEFREESVGLDNLFRYLTKFFRIEELREVWRMYNVLPSRRWKYKGGVSTAFPQFDTSGRCRQVKVIAYDPDTGHRLHEEDPAIYTKSDGSRVEDRMNRKVWFAGRSLVKERDVHFEQVMFGTHLLGGFSHREVVRVVEAEKTALICALSAPKSLGGVWVATGGSNGAGWTSDTISSTLRGHKVVLYPDTDMYEDWSAKADKLVRKGVDVEVSRFLEDHSSLEEKSKGWDLADYILKIFTNKNSKYYEQK